MTTQERIDHAAAARRIVRTARATTDTGATAAVAQVHATLALVEQQRAANLLALAAMQVELPDGGTLGTSREGVIWLRTEAAELIGGVPDSLPEARDGLVL